MSVEQKVPGSLAHGIRKWRPVKKQSSGQGWTSHRAEDSSTSGMGGSPCCHDNPFRLHARAEHITRLLQMSCTPTLLQAFA